MHETYADSLSRGARAGETLDALHVRRMCCRRMFLGYVDTHAAQMAYPNVDLVLDQGGTVLLRRSKATAEVSCD